MQTPAFLVLATLLAAFPVLGREKVLEDTPSRLTLEIQVPAFHVATELGGVGVSAEGFPNSDKTGAPDLPVYGFQVASGAQTPSVSIVPEEWVELTLPQALAGVPKWLTPTQAEADKDPLLFAAAKGLGSQVSALQRYRGMSLRSINVSMGTYDGFRGVRMLKRFRVQVTFADARPSPDLRVRPWLKQAAVKNAQGGAYLTSLSVSHSLAKAAALPIVTLGTPYVKIQIGDQQVDGFSEDGVYSLKYETVQALVPAGISVSNLRMYAGPKDTLPARVSAPLPPTLREIPIEVLDESGDTVTTGTFGAGYTILFYAHGTSVWNPIAGAPGPIHWKFGSDPYSFYNYYYLDWSGNNNGSSSAMRLATNPVHAAIQTTVTSAPHYLRAEHDVATGSCNPSPAFDNETGFDWYWYVKNQNCGSSSVSMTLSSLQLKSSTIDTLKGTTGDTTWIGMFNYAADPTCNFGIFSGGKTLTCLYNNPAFASLSGAWYVQPVGSPQLGFDSVQWGGNDPNFEGYTVKYTRTLDWAVDSSQNRIVFPAATGKWVGYQIANGSGLLCLRIEAGVGARWLSVQNVNGGGLFTDSVGDGDDVQYYLYKTAHSVNASAVVLESMRQNPGVIWNYASAIGAPQYVIVSPDALISGALNLQNYRATSKQSVMSLSTSVIRTEDIYREWSGGRFSPMAIRDALQYILQQDPSLHYVLLYGDGHYDYRNILNGSSSNPLPNYIPPFNWDDPTDRENPMSTDDFYAVLDSGSDWKTGLLDVALGRLSIQSLDQAQNYFDKMQQYENPSTSGEWRGHVTLTADDATQHGNPGNIDPVCTSSETFCHTNESEQFAQTILGLEPGIMMEKIYLFDYTANAVFQKPEAATDLITNLNQGTLFFSFFGHGAYNQLADEVLMQTNDALARLRNSNLAFMAAAFSCTVGRFDKLQDEGMLEQFVRQKDFGAIVGFGASRESYPEPNLTLGKALASRLFLPEVDSLPPQGVGDAIQNAKNNSVVMSDNFGQRYNKQKYTLLGEPVMVIRRPGPTIQVDSAPSGLSSLQCGTLRGRIAGGSGSGFISARILGGDVLKTYTYSLGIGDTNSGIQTAEKRGPILFERTVPYVNSAFSMDYFLPKDVPFGDTGKIQLFAWDASHPLENTHAITGLVIQGTAPPSACSIKNNGTGPQITVTGCNVKESGGVNFPDQVKISLPYCLQIDVTDSSGGVISGDGPDEGTTVELTGVIDPYHPLPGVDDLYHKSYQVTLENGQVPAGTHLLKVTARDGFGNLSLRQISLETSTLPRRTITGIPYCSDLVKVNPVS